LSDLPSDGNYPCVYSTMAFQKLLFFSTGNIVAQPICQETFYLFSGIISLSLLILKKNILKKRTYYSKLILKNLKHVNSNIDLILEKKKKLSSKRVSSGLNQ